MNRTHAAPLTAVDQVEPTPGGVRAEKRVVADDPYLAGHYPDFAIYPGVFTIESVHQAVRAMVSAERGDHARAEIAAIVSVRLNAPLLPGDALTVRADRVPSPDQDLVRVKAVCLRADDVVAARMTLDVRVTSDAPTTERGQA
ncbi:3-hydroxyacyl-ACP dehydratase FabZ family protein [Saccharothrix sp. HUAS TT1]|uniref:3-hydroxyacyl-ACP dehydratase FabZ family protein n=1 Tax=unclassified Saccharothrix TaxID=2593673 RepID=UPI00345BA844